MGVGLELGAVKRLGECVLVVLPIAGGAADRGGVEPGDVIDEIDGQRVAEMDFETALHALRGAPGSRLRLSLQRRGVSAPIDLTLVRERIRILRVRSRQVYDGVAWLRINSLSEGVEEQLAEHAALLLRGSKRGPTLVIDLRNNPGGELDRIVMKSFAH